MRRLSVRVLAVTGLAGTIAALLLPWAQYGGISVRLTSFPSWVWYLCIAATVQLLVISAVLAEGQPVAASHLLTIRVTGLVGVAGAVVAAVVVARHYDNAAALFGAVVPAVPPLAGPGGPIAVVAALFNAGALILLAPWSESGTRLRRA